MLGGGSWSKDIPVQPAVVALLQVCHLDPYAMLAKQNMALVLATITTTTIIMTFLLKGTIITTYLENHRLILLSYFIFLFTKLWIAVST